jgi:hypothetical protein
MAGHLSQQVLLACFKCFTHLYVPINHIQATYGWNHDSFDFSKTLFNKISQLPSGAGACAQEVASQST